MERIWQAARHWYAAGMQPAIQVCLRRDGRVVLDRAIGHAWGNGPTDPPEAEKVVVSLTELGASTDAVTIVPADVPTERSSERSNQEATR